MNLDVYAKIQNGVVVNIQMINPTTDYMDPAFTWVDLTSTSLYCADGTAIQPGTQYSAGTFSNS